MAGVERFQEYARAFEDFAKSDDPAVLEPFFSEHVVYEILGGGPLEGRHVGRAAVLAHLTASLDGFDRRFATRELQLLEGPVERAGAVWMRWRANYRSPGLPELSIDGEETAHFEGDRISRLEDRLPPEATSIMQVWFEAYGDRLPTRA
jgi:hypothetical protein